MSDTAPQQPPVEREVRQVVLSPMGIAVLDRIAALESQLASLQQANVMARDIADQSNQRALKAERELAEAHTLIACLADKPEDRLWHAQDGTWWRREGDRLVAADPPPVLAEAQERLAMAVEALERAQGWVCVGACDKLHHATCTKIHRALAATAEAVAQHTAEVERRGAAKQIKRLLDTFNRDSTHTWLTGEYLRVRDGISDNPLARVWVQRVSDGYWLAHNRSGWIEEKPDVAGYSVTGAAQGAAKELRMKLDQIRLVEGEPAGAHRQRAAELEAES